VTPSELIATASALARRFSPSDDCNAGDVAAALVTAGGHVYTGVSVDTACSLGFCAEHAAVAEMLKGHESEIAMVVAVDRTGAVLSPCGRCRELMLQVAPTNRATHVVLALNQVVALGDLLPHRERSHSGS